MQARAASPTLRVTRNLALLALLGSACSVGMAPDAAAAKAVMSEDVPRDATKAEVETPTTKATTQTAKRMVIRNARLHITMDDPALGAKEAAAIAERAGGFVLDSQMQGDHGTGRTAELSLRIPAPAYEQSFDAFRALGEVERESSSGEDVTEEFVDLEAQLRSQRALEERITAMLESTTTIDEALRIQTEMTRVRTEIERIEGRARYLQEHAAMSTFDLHLASPEQPAPARSSESIGSRIRNAFGDAGSVLLAIFLGGIRAMGVLLPLGVFFLLGLGLFRRMRRTA